MICSFSLCYTWLYFDIIWIQCDLLWFTEVYSAVLWHTLFSFGVFCFMIYSALCWDLLLYYNVLFFTVIYAALLQYTLLYCDILFPCDIFCFIVIYSGITLIYSPVLWYALNLDIVKSSWTSPLLIYNHEKFVCFYVNNKRQFFCIKKISLFFPIVVVNLLPF